MSLTREFYELFLDDLKEELKKQKKAEILHVYISPVCNGEGSLGHIAISYQLANYSYYGLSFNLMDDGQIFHDSSTLSDKRLFYAHIFRWADYVRSRLYAADRIKNFWEDAKEELVATAWRPERVAKWLEAGIDAEAM